MQVDTGVAAAASRAGGRGRRRRPRRGRLDRRRRALRGRRGGRRRRRSRAPQAIAPASGTPALGMGVSGTAYVAYPVGAGDEIDVARLDRTTTTFAVLAGALSADADRARAGRRPDDHRRRRRDRRRRVDAAGRRTARPHVFERRVSAAGPEPGARRPDAGDPRRRRRRLGRQPGGRRRLRLERRLGRLPRDDRRRLARRRRARSSATSCARRRSPTRCAAAPGTAVARPRRASRSTATTRGCSPAACCPRNALVVSRARDTRGAVRPGPPARSSARRPTPSRRRRSPRSRPTAAASSPTAPAAARSTAELFGATAAEPGRSPLADRRARPGRPRRGPRRLRPTTTATSPSPSSPARPARSPSSSTPIVAAPGAPRATGTQLLDRRRASRSLHWQPSAEHWAPPTYAVYLDGAQVTTHDADQLRAPGGARRTAATRWKVVASDALGQSAASSQTRRLLIDAAPPVAGASRDGRRTAGQHADVHGQRRRAISGVRSVTVDYGDGQTAHARCARRTPTRRPGATRSASIVTDRAGVSAHGCASA